MQKWTELAATIYYTGVGVVLFGTGVRFLYRLIKNYDEDRKFMNELKEIYLINIYEALDVIARKLDVNLPPKHQALNPSQEKDGHYKIGH